MEPWTAGGALHTQSTGSIQRSQTVMRLTAVYGNAYIGDIRSSLVAVKGELTRFNLAA